MPSVRQRFASRIEAEYQPAILSPGPPHVILFEESHIVRAEPRILQRGAAFALENR